MQILEVVPTKSVDGRTQRKRQEVQRCSQISGVHTYWDTSVTHLVSNIGVRTCLQGVEMERNKLSYIINLRNIHSKSITSNTEQGIVSVRPLQTAVFRRVSTYFPSILPYSKLN